MNLNFFLMNGHGMYVWASFLITFFACLFLFLKTKKALKKIEREFAREIQGFSEEKIKVLEKQKIPKEILVSQSKT